MPDFSDTSKDGQSKEEVVNSIFGLLGSLGISTTVPTTEELIKQNGIMIRDYENGILDILEYYDPTFCDKRRTEDEMFCRKQDNCIACKLAWVRSQLPPKEDNANDTNK